MSAIEGVAALTFDVFGTVVDWHGTVSREMEKRAQQSTSQEVKEMTAKGERCVKTLPACCVDLRFRLWSFSDWSDFAKEWRRGYMVNT